TATRARNAERGTRDGSQQSVERATKNAIFVPRPCTTVVVSVLLVGLLLVEAIAPSLMATGTGEALVSWPARFSSVSSRSTWLPRRERLRVPAQQAPDADLRPVEEAVVYHQWGVAPRAPVQGRGSTTVSHPHEEVSWSSRIN